jgi:hypothetical protein
VKREVGNWKGPKMGRNEGGKEGRTRRRKRVVMRSAKVPDGKAARRDEETGRIGGAEREAWNEVLV